jgi:hypothetical protein
LRPSQREGPGLISGETRPPDRLRPCRSAPAGVFWPPPAPAGATFMSGLTCPSGLSVSNWQPKSVVPRVRRSNQSHTSYGRRRFQPSCGNRRSGMQVPRQAASALPGPPVEAGGVIRASALRRRTTAIAHLLLSGQQEVPLQWVPDRPAARRDGARGKHGTAGNGMTGYVGGQPVPSLASRIHLGPVGGKLLRQPLLGIRGSGNQRAVAGNLSWLSRVVRVRSGTAVWL